jgi:hypothetical protein
MSGSSLVMRSHCSVNDSCNRRYQKVSEMRREHAPKQLSSTTGHALLYYKCSATPHTTPVHIHSRRIITSH